jgi:hypothetical protein
LFVPSTDLTPLAVDRMTAEWLARAVFRGWLLGVPVPPVAFAPVLDVQELVGRHEFRIIFPYR